MWILILIFVGWIVLVSISENRNKGNGYLYNKGEKENEFSLFKEDNELKNNKLDEIESIKEQGNNDTDYLLKEKEDNIYWEKFKMEEQKIKETYYSKYD